MRGLFLGRACLRVGAVSVLLTAWLSAPTPASAQDATAASGALEAPLATPYPAVEEPNGMLLLEGGRISVEPAAEALRGSLSVRFSAEGPMPQPWLRMGAAWHRACWECDLSLRAGRYRIGIGTEPTVRGLGPPFELAQSARVDIVRVDRSDFRFFGALLVNLGGWGGIVVGLIIAAAAGAADTPGDDPIWWGGVGAPMLTGAAMVAVGIPLLVFEDHAEITVTPRVPSS